MDHAFNLSLFIAQDGNYRQLEFEEYIKDNLIIKSSTDRHRHICLYHRVLVIIFYSFHRQCVCMSYSKLFESLIIYIACYELRLNYASIKIN